MVTSNGHTKPMAPCPRVDRDFSGSTASGSPPGHPGTDGPGTAGPMRSGFTATYRAATLDPQLTRQGQETMCFCGCSGGREHRAPGRDHRATSATSADRPKLVISFGEAHLALPRSCTGRDRAFSGTNHEAVTIRAAPRGGPRPQAGKAIGRWCPRLLTPPSDAPQRQSQPTLPG
jgi:hypothetical protein